MEFKVCIISYTLPCTDECTCMTLCDWIQEVSLSYHNYAKCMVYMMYVGKPSEVLLVYDYTGFLPYQP